MIKDLHNSRLGLSVKQFFQWDRKIFCKVEASTSGGYFINNFDNIALVSGCNNKNVYELNHPLNFYLEICI